MTFSDSQRPWWQDAVVYQIYPRSFADSNGDGIGDLQGIIAHLDDLNDGTDQSLGIDAIWLSPIYPSPMKDFGYDVSDYRAIAPEFGTLDDFRTLLEEAHQRGIRVIMDLVMNHCSSEHPWFVEASSSRDTPLRDWFIWHDGRPARVPLLAQGTGGMAPPNQWMAMFGGSAWTWEPRTKQFYLHSFLPEQPDLNWRNPEVKDAMWDMMRYWLEMGVDGFRLDVINWFIKDAELRNNPAHRLGPRPYDRQEHVYDRNRPEMLELIKELRHVVDEYPDRMTVGEVGVEPPGDPALPAQYYGGGRGLHMAFNFAFLYCPWRAKSFLNAIRRWESLLDEDSPHLWPNYTLSNHDQSRAFSRYGGSDARAKVAAALLLTLRGTPFLYYGEEIGMRDGWIPPWRLQDPPGKRYWPVYQGRDPVRTPMQWSAERHGGFSTVEPWLPVNGNYRSVNVATQRLDPTSLYTWYRRLIAARRRHAALRRGSLRIVPQRSNDILCYLRESDDEAILVALNFSSRTVELVLPRAVRWQMILSSNSKAAQSIAGRQRWLTPNEALIARRSEK